MSTTKGHIRFINGLKGFACLFIMLGHFASLYKYAEDASLISSPILQYIPGFFTILITEQFWLRLFFVISGFLVSKSNIDGVRVFVAKAVTRFLRLGLPILGASLIILVIDKVFGMQNQAIQVIVNNTWITKSYKIPLTFIAALEEPFKVLLFGERRFNAVFWVLKDMFFASIIVYFITLIKNMIKKKTSAEGLENSDYASDVGTDLVFGFIKNEWIVIILIVACYVKQRDIYGSVLIGAILGYSNELMVRILKKCKPLSWCSLALPLVSFLAGYYGVVDQTLIVDISFALFIAAVEVLKVPNDLFSKIDKLGDYSFGIYALHWPVFCSIGFLFLECMIGAGNGFFIYCLTILLCCVITFLLAAIFAMTVEKWTGKLCSRIGRLLSYGLT